MGDRRKVAVSAHALQELFHLGDFHVFKTNEFGRHVIGTDCLRPIDCSDVLEASSCDWAFKRGIRINEYRGRWLSIVNQNEEDTLWIFGSSYVNVQRVNLALMKVYSSTYSGF